MLALSCKRKFLLKCDYCDLVLSIEVDEEKDKESIEKINNNDFLIECPCGEGICSVLLD